MKKTVAIIGGGAAALFAAAFLDEKKFEVSIYEKNKALGRKFLVAGDGGFNLTHSEDINQFIKRYTPSAFLEEALLHFDNQDLQHWLKEIGIPTFIGSSNRVYPNKGIKPIKVLQAILAVLNKKGVKIYYEHQWEGWNNKNNLIFNTEIEVHSDLTIFSLGGGSWNITGSNSNWLNLFKNQGIGTFPFQASNCAYAVKWPAQLLKKHEGDPLKNIALSCLEKTQKGELVLTAFGLEGNAIYALSPEIRQQFKANQTVIIYLDLKPTLSVEEIEQKLLNSATKNTTTTLREKLRLSPVQLSLLKLLVNKDTFTNPSLLAKSIKSIPLTLTAIAPLNEAISTVGGISLNAIDTSFQLKNMPNAYCIGEMLNYDAPTGGYLLQSCFSMGVFVAKGLNEKT